MSYTDQDFEQTAASHTPGFWEPTDALDLPGQTPYAPTLDGWIGVQCSDEANGDIVAYCHPANARLIAAAPDMLQALLLAQEVLRQHGLGGLDQNPFAVHDLIGSAIYKATGK